MIVTDFSVSPLFNYSKTMMELPLHKRHDQSIQEPVDVDYPMGVTHFRSGFFSMLRKRTQSRKNKDIIDRNHHEKFDYQGINYLIHDPFEMFSKKSAVHQTIMNHSIIVHLHPQSTIIDKALERFKPKRFKNK